MKKWISLVLLLMMVLLAGCGQGTQDSTGTTQGSELPTVPTEDDGFDGPVLPMGQIRSVGNFREGRAFAVRESDGATVCIDDRGRIRFVLAEGYVPDPVTGGAFFNGLAVVQIEEELSDGTTVSRSHLCKEDGTIVTPELFDGRRFLLSHSLTGSVQERFFADGHIMVEGDGKLGLLNSTLEWDVPMSAEYRSVIEDFVLENTPDGWDAEFYYDSGKLLSGKGYIDIVTGERGDISEVVLPFPSDFWVEWRDTASVMFQDALSPAGDMALVLDGLLAEGIRIPSITFFGGSAPVLTIGGEGETFTLIGEDGEARFQPIRVYGSAYDYDPVSGRYCVFGNDTSGDLRIQLFDANGIVSTFLYDVPEKAVHSKVTFHDEIITVCIRYGSGAEDDISWELYDMEFQKLY